MGVSSRQPLQAPIERNAVDLRGAQERFAELVALEQLERVSQSVHCEHLLFILYLQLALQIDQGCVKHTHRRLGHHGVLLVA